LGTVVLVARIVVLVTPRAAHAVATIVEVVNTIAESSHHAECEYSVT
jgi:hypothetical protein